MALPVIIMAALAVGASAWFVGRGVRETADATGDLMVDIARVSIIGTVLLITLMITWKKVRR